MSSPAGGIRRVVVALDASRGSLAALEAAAALAPVLAAELVGVYVEDRDLLCVVEDPLAREIDYFSGRPRPLRARHLLRQLRLQASRAREALERSAEAGEVPWSFHTAKGRPAGELVRFLLEGDLLVLGARSRFPGRGPGSTVKAVIAGTSEPVLVVSRRPAPGPAVQVLHDGSPEGNRALEFARRLAVAQGRQLVVHFAGTDESSREAAIRDAGKALEGTGVTLRVRSTAVPDPSRLLRSPPTPRAGLVVVGRSALGSDPTFLRDLLLRWGGRLLVVG